MLSLFMFLWHGKAAYPVLHGGLSQMNFLSKNTHTQSYLCTLRFCYASHWASDMKWFSPSAQKQIWYGKANKSHDWQFNQPLRCFTHIINNWSLHLIKILQRRHCCTMYIPINNINSFSCFFQPPAPPCLIVSIKTHKIPRWDPRTERL